MPRVIERNHLVSWHKSLWMIHVATSILEVTKQVSILTFEIPS
jgi:hypothetical protein